MAFVAVALTGVTLFASCSEDDETISSSYTVEVENVSMSGSDSQSAMTYMNAVSEAYQKAVGMTSDNGMKLDGAVSKHASSLKAKFDATTLPTNAPDASVCTYTFTMVLAGYDSAGRTVIASRTFTNK